MSPRSNGRGRTAVQARPRSPARAAERTLDRCGAFVIDPQRVRRGREAVLADRVVGDVAGTFKVLSHPTRVRIIQALAGGELCVCELSEVVGLSVSATSHQLRIMRDLRLVRARSEGKLVHYSLSDPFVVALLEDCTRHVQSGGVGR